MAWAIKEFSLEGVLVGQFRMRGRDMCAMGKENFLARTPPFMGDILWEHLEILQKGKIHMKIHRRLMGFIHVHVVPPGAPP